MPQIEAADASHPGRPVQTMSVEDGPLLVRGAATIRVDDQTHTVNRPAVAVCRCERTSRPPWCDGTHHLLNRKR